MLDDAGMQRWLGSLNSPSDSSDVIVFTIPTGYAVQGYSLALANVAINGARFNLSAMSNSFYRDSELQSFSSGETLEAGSYTITMANGPVVLDYTLTLNLVSLEADQVPSLTGSGTLATYLEDQAAVGLFPALQASTGNSSQMFTGLRLQIDGVQDGEEVLRLDGIDIALVAGAGGNLPSGGSYSLVSASGGLSLELSGLALAPAQLESLLAGITYRNDSQAPVEGARSITLEWLQDSGQTQNETAPNITASITVQGVNDAPTAGGATLAPVSEDSDARIITSAELLGTTLDAESDPITVTDLQLVSGTGTLTPLDAGEWSYTPGANVYGEVRFAYTLSDGQDEASGAAILPITPVNDPAVLVTSTQAAAYVENAAAQAIDDQITVTDIDSLTLTTARVAIVANYQAGSDMLGFVNDGQMGNIVAAFDSVSGTLTLTSVGGTATLAHWQAALRSVSFTSTSDAPGTSRTISFIINDGVADSLAATRTLAIESINDAPQLTSPLSISLLEDVGVPLTGITVADADAPGSVLTLTLTVGSGRLAATSVGGVTAAGTDETLTLTGTAADINAVIAGGQVLFTAAANDVRDVTLQMAVSDGVDGDSSSVTLRVGAVNDAPQLSGVDGVASYAEGASPVYLAPLASLADVDLDAALGGVDALTGAQLVLTRDGGASSDDLFSLLPSASALFTVADDVLLAGGLAFGQISLGSGRLQIDFNSSATQATRALVEAVLQHVAYQNQAFAPEASVALRWTFSDGGASGQGGAKTVTDVMTVNLSDVDRVPVLLVDPAPVAFTEGGSVAVGAALVDLVDDSSLLGARVSIDQYRDGDVLAFSTGTTGIVVQDLGEGRYALAGGSPAELLEVLRSATFGSSSDDPTADDANARRVDFTIDDGVHTSAVASVSVAVTAVNDAPVLAVAQGGSLSAGRSLMLSSAMLRASDVDDAVEGIEYAVTQLSASGRLQLAGVDLVVGDVITQADIDAGRVSFVADGVGRQTFAFTLRDGGEDGALATSNIALTLTVSAPPSPPAAPAPSTDSVDGVDVQTGTITEADGTVTTVVTVPVVTDDRVDDTGEATVANIPLVTGGDGTSLLTASIPSGIGLQASGPAAPLLTSGALEGLIRTIQGLGTPGGNDQQGMIDGATGFVQGLSGAASLLLQTLTLQGGADRPSGTLTLNGAPGATDTPTTALVIDAGGLPAGVDIVLDNVPFAAVIGGATVVAGQGGQTLVADGASQTIVAGAGDQVFAGGGSDLLQFDGLGSGNALLHGGSGADGATFGGSIADYVITQGAASVTIRPIDASGDAVTLVNIEMLTFADGQQAVQTDASAGWLAGVYQQAFGREADLGGLEFWSGVLSSGGARSEVLRAMLTSPEIGAVLDVSTSDARSQTLDVLYQSLFGRTADETGKAFWQAVLDQGGSLSDVIEAFATSVEMQQHVLAADQWAFIV
ncbi:tandem-95 repeat protein [Stutzerimonas urumqiensis]|uniref:tandem-95 repeat protein n=1 Tax=Stutzerimonas urumqiensis TaxID=638269 RepID=UPI0013CEBC53|nr:tandem-95 repeat protein [Stutzerimonas urumqiensis]